MERRSALPEPVLSTLFGKGAVHTLDGATHRQRKDLFVSPLKEPGDVAVLAERARTAQDLVAMVDGFATAGPRHWQARHARRRQEQRLAELIEETRRFELRSDAKRTALHVVAERRDADGESLSPRTAAVELLNIIRPTIAITRYVTFGAHALHRHPEFRAPLATERQDYARAFAHEVRRFYPFAPFAAGVAPDDVEWHGEQIAKGTTGSRSPREHGSCSTSTGKTTTPTCGTSPTPSTPNASWAANPDETSSSPRAAARRPRGVGAPARTSHLPF